MAVTSCIGSTSSSLVGSQGGTRCRYGAARSLHAQFPKAVSIASPLLHSCSRKFQEKCLRSQLVIFRRAARQSVRARGKGDASSSDSRFGESDGYGLYPWEQPNSSVKDSGQGDDWVREPLITLLTTYGVVQLGGERVPARRAQAWQRRQSGKVGQLRVFREDAYMNPQQRLCLGATFDIHATNGLDLGRRLTVLGFCRSVAMLSDVVEDMVVDQGGQVVHADLENGSGLHERLVMTVHVPMLWGVPPQLDSLKHAIRSGGGIVQKTYRQWQFR